MRKWLLAFGAAVIPLVVWAQSAPNWPTGYRPSSAELNAAFAGKEDVGAGFVNPMITNPAITGGTISNSAITGGTVTNSAITNTPISGSTGAFTTITGDTSAATSTATGSTTARTDAARFAERVNVRDYGAVCDNVTDDSAAFIAAVNRVNTLWTAGIATVIYVPPGKCLIKGTNGALPRFAQNTSGGVVGEGPQRSWVIMDASYTGDLFSWSTSWLDGDFPNPINGAANTVRTASVKTGPLVRGLSIVGDRTAAAAQYGLRFYDRNDFVRVENVDFFYIKGGAISVGATSVGGTDSGMRESSFSNVRIFNSGDAGIPAFGFTAVGAAAGTPIKFNDIDIYGSYGPGLSIRNNNASVPVGGYYFSKLRVEGLESNPPGVAADNVVIGDPNETGAIGGIDIRQANLLSPYANFCALRVTGHDAPTRPTGIYVDGGIAGGGLSAGKGLCLDAVRASIFRLSITSTDTNYTIGPLVGTNVTLDLNGAGPASVTSSVDPAAWRVIQTPTFTTGDLVSQKMSFALTPHDGSVTGGSGMSPGGVDLQMIRGQAGHSATAANATIGGGLENQASAAQCTIGGGNLNLCTGQFSAIPGGSTGADGGRFGLLAFSAGRYSLSGDAQLASAVLRGSGSTAAAFRLTSGGGAASNVSGTMNCMNIPNNFAYGFRVHLHARNFTTPGQDYDWVMPNAMIVRGTGVASTVVTLGTPLILPAVPPVGAAVTATQDTTNGCLDLQFAPPTANTTDVWHAVARIDSIEVQ